LDGGGTERARGGGGLERQGLEEKSETPNTEKNENELNDGQDKDVTEAPGIRGKIRHDRVVHIRKMGVKKNLLQTEGEPVEKKENRHCLKGRI